MNQQKCPDTRDSENRLLILCYLFAFSVILNIVLLIALIGLCI